MVSKGTAPLKQIFEMLDHCAKGYHAIEKTHNWWILYNGWMMMKRCAFCSPQSNFPQKCWILAPEKSFDAFWERLPKNHSPLLITTENYDTVS
jgi:hypothetical protein